MSTSTQLSPGTKLNSTACTAQVLVVRPPSAAVEITCGGAAMDAEGRGQEADPTADGVVLGKRYVDEHSSLELLCTRAGAGPLKVDGREMVLKTTKPLPASD